MINADVRLLVRSYCSVCFDKYSDGSFTISSITNISLAKCYYFKCKNKRCSLGREFSVVYQFVTTISNHSTE